MMNRIFDTKTTFEQLGLRRSVIKGLNESGYDCPTSIQSVAVPLILQGTDVLIRAKAGMGKTATYGLPILHMAEKDRINQAIVLRPQNDLVVQACGELRALGQFTPIRSRFLLQSGELMRDRSNNKRQESQVLLAGPGPILELLNNRKIDADGVCCVVIDGLDRMVELGLDGDIGRLLGYLRTNRQTIVIADTLSDQVELLANEFTTETMSWAEPQSDTLIVALSEHRCLTVASHHKQEALLNLLRSISPNESVVVFCDSKATQNKLSAYLRDNGIRLRESSGHRARTQFRRDRGERPNGRILVTSGADVHAIPFKNVSHLIHYDLPENPEVYVHLSGRVVRTDQPAMVWSLLDPHKVDLLDTLETYMKVEIERAEQPGGLEVATGIESETGEVSELKQQEDEQISLNSLLGRVLTVDVSQLSEQQTKNMFPDGRIPKTVPTPTLGSRFKPRGR